MVKKLTKEYEKFYWETHQTCPECGLSTLQMSKGETRTCPICFHTWRREL